MLMHTPDYATQKQQRGIQVRITPETGGSNNSSGEVEWRRFIGFAKPSPGNSSLLFLSFLPVMVWRRFFRSFDTIPRPIKFQNVKFHVNVKRDQHCPAGNLSADSPVKANQLLSTPEPRNAKVLEVEMDTIPLFFRNSRFNCNTSQLYYITGTER